MSKSAVVRTMHLVWAIVLAVVVVIGVLWAYPDVPQIRSLNQSPLCELKGKWVEESETQASFEIPLNYGSGLALSVGTYQTEMAVLLRDSDDTETLVYSYVQNDSTVLTRLMIALPYNAAGKTLVLRCKRPSALKYMITQTSVIGGQGRVVMYLIRINLYALVFTLFCAICSLGLLTTAVFIWRYLKHEMKRMVVSAAALLFDGGVWILMDSQLVRLFSARSTLISLCSLVAFTLIIPLTLEFMCSMLKHRYRWIRAFQNVTVVLLIADILGWRFAGKAIFWLLTEIHISIFIGLVLVLRVTVKEYRESKDKNLKYVLVAFGVLCVAALLAMLMYYMHQSRIYAIFYCVGLLAFLLVLSIVCFNIIKEHVGSQIKMESYKRMAFMDELTEMPNHAAFKRRQAVWNVRNDWVYIVMDVNCLKETNDACGHSAGDELLQSAAECIKKAFYHADSYYRIGGDEFIVISNTLSADVINRELECMRRVCEEHNKKAKYPLSIAMGYSMQSERKISPEKLFAEADAEMYRNKIEMKKLMGKTPR